jgi:hypothetical protein
MSLTLLKADDLRKAASALQTLSEQSVAYEKRAEATRLLFEQVERGFIPPPRSRQEYETKVASLMTKDLNVVAEAMKLATAPAGGTGFGTLEEGPTANGADSPAVSSEAARNFQHALMEA